MLIYIQKKELHLAAFIKASGIKFMDYHNDQFVFDSDISEIELRVQHSNSLALQVDRELFTLKTFLK